MSADDSKEIASLLASKANEDAIAVRELVANEAISDGIFGFHAQQAVEKWLKAVIASQGATFERTHDLKHLLAVAASSSDEPPVDVEQLIALTEYAVPLRYQELLDQAEPLDRYATLALVDLVGEWATARVEPLTS